MCRSFIGKEEKKNKFFETIFNLLNQHEIKLHNLEQKNKKINKSKEFCSGTLFLKILQGGGNQLAQIYFFFCIISFPITFSRELCLHFFQCEIAKMHVRFEWNKTRKH
jgi:hypothetical protein